MFQNGTIRTVFSTGISLVAGMIAIKLDLTNGWLTFVDWAGFYLPLCVLAAGAECEWERRGFI